MSEIINISMKLEIQDGQKPNFKRLEHHIEELLDLNEYPEIISVFSVFVTDDIPQAKEAALSLLSSVNA